MSIQGIPVRALFAILLALPVTAGAQEAVPVVIGESFEIASDVLAESRPIQVHTPSGYETGERAYPVLYLLDGPTHFLHTVGSVDHLSRNRRMPPMIVVAVGNTSGNRTRDLTPPATDAEAAAQLPTAGGADAFLRFLTDELRPWVADRYRTTDYDLLVGHSFGGLLITHLLDTDPEAFDAYISISPSLWWDNGAFTSRLETMFERHPEAALDLYMTMGNEGGAMIAGAWRFLGVLETAAPADFRWRWQPMPDEDHGSVPARSTHDGLEWIFEDYAARPQLAALRREGASALPALLAHYERIHARFDMLPYPPESFLNSAGFGLIFAERPDDAVVVFEKAVELYPGSANAHDSLGDGLVAVCRLPEAREHYERAIRMADDAGLALAEAYRESLDELDALEREGGRDCADR